jgi:hypothetical protein
MLQVTYYIKLCDSHNNNTQLLYWRRYIRDGFQWSHIIYDTFRLSSCGRHSVSSTQDVSMSGLDRYSAVISRSFGCLPISDGWISHTVLYVPVVTSLTVPCAAVAPADGAALLSSIASSVVRLPAGCPVSLSSLRGVVS